MKKFVTIMIILIIIVYGIFAYRIFFKNNTNNYKDAGTLETTKKKTENKEKDKEENKYVDNNPIIVSLYKKYQSGVEREKMSEYKSKWSYHNDISSFEVYYTNEDKIPETSQQALFLEYANKFENAFDYKIGYHISFKTKDNEINKTILSPKDTEEFFKYLEIYLYDDYHRTPGVWYSHTIESEMNDETLLTSIKLTSGENIDMINSDITLTVFTYDNDDFDKDNNYIGNSKYSIVVKKNI